LALASHIGDTPGHVLVCFDPSYIHEAPGVTKQLQSMFPNTVFIVGRPPPCIDLASRSLANSDNAEDVCLVGGLLFRPSDLALPSLTLVYVGDKSEQLASIQLEYPQNAIVHINPGNKTCISLRGENSRIFRERYGGVVAVQEASVVGLVVGSMGIEGALVKEMLTRLQVCVVIDLLYSVH
jgi:diphthamide biosynthesis enzyme Dph1/Dph2-like protein